MIPLNHPIGTQRGTILVVGMMLLIILTLIGITTLNNTAVTEKLTQNLRDTTAAFDAAESALSCGEQWVQSQTATPVPVSTCSSPPCLVWQSGVLSNLNQMGSSWWQTQGIAYASTIPTAFTQPRYVIELFSYAPSELSPDALSKGKGYYYYRVTAQGTGVTTNSSAYVQSIYATQFN